MEPHFNLVYIFYTHGRGDLYSPAHTVHVVNPGRNQWQNRYARMPRHSQSALSDGGVSSMLHAYWPCDRDEINPLSIEICYHQDIF